MKTKKLLPIGLTTMLFVTMLVFTAQPASAFSGNAIGLNPGSYEGTYVCESFNVDVNISITGMAGYEIQIWWNNTLLNCTGVVNTPPTGWIHTTTQFAPYYNSTHGLYWFYAAKLPAESLTGNYTVCTMTFHVEYQPYYPEGDAHSKIYIDYPGWAYPAKISDIGGSAIAHVGYDCDYSIKTKTPPEPILDVIDPVDLDTHFAGQPMGPIPCGGLFDVDIKIRDLAAALDLCGWEAKLSFDTTWLTAVGYKNGTFLQFFAGPSGVYPICNINNTLGIVHMADMFLGNHTKPYGAGTLMTIIFNASAQYTVPPGTPPELSDLDLYDTKLSDCSSAPINHTANNATYEAPYKTVGWALDCFTDCERKKCITPFCGVGINQTADSYEPQDQVIIYSKLEYNNEPEAYKLVMFEIYGPRNPYYNISYIRTAWTNASGIATINFTIPGSGVPYWYEMVAGKWVCYQAAQVKLGEKPEDWLFFEVGWIIEITDVIVITPNENGVKKCEYINVTICYKNIMMIPKWVLFTVVAQDVLLDPIQEETWWVHVPAAEYGPVEPVPGFPGVYASNPVPFYNCTWELSHIPQWTHVGEATVYVNAFTDLPMNCGCPYCPEMTATFWVLPTADP